MNETQDSQKHNKNQSRSLGVLGEPGVNVLELNISLEEEAPLK